MDKQNKKEITRRRFLKTLGIGAGVTTAALYGCGDKVQSTGEPGKETSSIPLGKMPPGIWLHAPAHQEGE